jgi:hypothetical protein
MDGFPLTADGIKGWCDRRQLRYEVNEQLGQMRIPRRPEQVPIRIVPRPERSMVTLALPVPVKVPPDRLGEVERAIAIANAQSFMGCWVATESQGELYFRITLPAEGALWSDKGFEFVIQVLVGTFDEVGPALFKVATQGASAETLRAAASPKARA